MIRLVIILLLIAALSVGISIIAEEPGQVAIDWGVRHIEMSVLTLIAIIALSALVCVLAYWLFFAIVRGPKKWAQSRLMKRQALGLTALTETFAAIASQDVRGAKRYLKRAEGLLPDQPLTLMLASQVARLDGNDSKSQLYLERMSKSGMTEFIALRGLVETARKAGDNASALRHAEKAYDMRPGDHWLATMLIAQYAVAGRMDEALRTLERAARRRALHADEVHQIRSALLCTQAAGQPPEQAIASLRAALRRNAKFVPAIVQLADIYIKKGDASMGLKVAGDGWRKTPHPEIDAALLRCFDVAKDKSKAAKIIRKLAKIHAGTDEAQMLMAGLAHRQGDHASAIGILKHLITTSGETGRICSMLGAIEHAQENHDQEAHWYRRAKESPSGAPWECSSCNRPATSWELICPQCGSVGSIV